MISRPFLYLRPLPQLRPASSIRGVRRLFSVIAVYQSFPASLLRYNARKASSLFDYKKLQERETDPMDDAIEIAENGLVYPAVSNRLPFSNGATLMPNTFMMQEHIRTYLDQYFDDKEMGKDVETPFIYRVRKGTPIPSYLTLFHEHDAQFSLQPSQPMPIKDLNRALDEFFTKHAEEKTAEQWLDENDFLSAVADDAVEVWMAR